MSYGGPSNVRDNFGRFQKQATINLTRRLQEIANNSRKNLREDIAKELLKKYKENVLASYGSRGGETEYEHTDTFIEHIHVVIETDPGIGQDRVRIKLDEDVRYEQTSQRTVGQVYKFLTEGTKGGGGANEGLYKYWNGKYLSHGYNYPTPAHLFEQHTQWQMKGYLESLDVKKYVQNEAHKNKRGKKK
jgi:hypothetical protein